MVLRPRIIPNGYVELIHCHCLIMSEFTKVLPDSVV